MMSSLILEVRDFHHLEAQGGTLPPSTKAVIAESFGDHLGRLVLRIVRIGINEGQVCQRNNTVFVDGSILNKVCGVPGHDDTMVEEFLLDLLVLHPRRGNDHLGIRTTKSRC